ncbi:MAG: carboxypeptidase regulatory-like domain-containing protein [Planctomycetota bacterium]
MKTLQLLGATLCLAVAAAVLPACGSGSSSTGASAGGGATVTGGKLRISITDAPFPFDFVESASVVIREVQVRERERDAWEVVFNGSRTIDLVPLTNGVAELLVEVPIEPGTYDKVRLIVDAGEVVLKPEAIVKDDHIFNTADGDLFFPSGAQTGIKVDIENAIVVTTELSGDLMLDFPLDKNFVFNGPVTHAPGVMRVLFTPVVHATNTSTNGTVVVEVLSDNATPDDPTDDVPLENATVRLFDELDVQQASGPTDSLGLAQLSVVPGTYSLTVEAASHEPGEITGLVVFLANVTDAGTITLAANTEITGVVMSDGLLAADPTDDTNIEGADVSIIVSGDATETIVAQTTTDANGAFLLANLAPGTYDITVSKAGWTAETRTDVMSALPGAPGAGETFVLVPMLQTVVGTVTDGVPLPLEGLEVSILDANGTTILGSVMTDVDGMYTLTGVPSGEHTLRVSNGIDLDIDTAITVVGDDDADPSTDMTVDVVFTAP